MHYHTCSHCDGTGADPDGGYAYRLGFGRLKRACPACGEGEPTWACDHECPDGVPDECECADPEWSEKVAR